MAFLEKIKEKTKAIREIVWVSCKPAKELHIRRDLEKSEAWLRSELEETERQRECFKQQSEDYQAETKKLYAGIKKKEEEIQFLEFRNQSLSDLHDDVVLRKWTNENSRQAYCCKFPFERIEILPRGEVYTCCTSSLKSGYDIGNIFQHDIDEIWNSEHALKLRYSVSKGDFEYCNQHCTWLMNHKKLSEQGKVGPLVPRGEMKLAYETYQDCVLKCGPKNISLSCDETCNLRCPSCRSAPKGLNRKQEEELLDTLMTKIRPMLKDCRQLDLLGSGEVFASYACSSFLKTISKEEFPQLSLVLITNAQLFTRKKWEEFSNLNGMPITVFISVDGSKKETYEKLRLGGKWEVLMENLRFISELRQEGIITELTLNFVVQKENYEQMPDFVEMAKGFSADAVWFQYMSNWGTLTDEEYQEQNVFLPNHPLRGKASQILTDILAHTDGIRIIQDELS